MRKFLCSMAFLAVSFLLSAVTSLICCHVLFRGSWFHLCRSARFNNRHLYYWGTNIPAQSNLYIASPDIAPTSFTAHGSLLTEIPFYTALRCNPPPIYRHKLQLTNIGTVSWFGYVCVCIKLQFVPSIAQIAWREIIAVFLENRMQYFNW